MKRFFICCALIFLTTGCSGIHYSDFYGVSTRLNWANDDKFVIKSYDGINVEHTFENFPNSKISAWAEMKHNKLYVSLTNGSGQSIVTDYHFDSFIVTTHSGKEYALKKQSYNEYRFNADEVISPGGKAKFVLTAPDNLYREDIKKIVCKLGLLRGVRVLFKPLPFIEIGDKKNKTMLSEKKKADEALEALLAEETEDSKKQKSSSQPKPVDDELEQEIINWGLEKENL